jgi:DNA-binding NarL/FixJ family response regulator
LIRNLFLTARDSDGLVRQIIEESLTQTPHFGANRNRPAVTIPSVQAVREVLEGGSERDANAKEYVAPLTSKEREVVKLLVEGNGNKQTAAMLGISVKTVEAHRATIMHKLGLRSTRELMRYAFNKKIVAPADF